MSFLSKLFVGVLSPLARLRQRLLLGQTLRERIAKGEATPTAQVACPLDDRIGKSQQQLIFTLAAVVFLITPPLLAQATPLPSVADATFSTLSRRGTPKDILRGGGKRHACLTKANRRQRVNRHRLTR